MFMGIIHGQSFILIGITTNLKHSYTSPHYNVLAGAFFVGRLFPPQVNTFQPLKQGHLSTQDTFSHPKYHSCVQQQIASVTKSCKFILLLITMGRPLCQYRKMHALALLRGYLLYVVDIYRYIPSSEERDP